MAKYYFLHKRLWAVTVYHRPKSKWRLLQKIVDKAMDEQWVAENEVNYDLYTEDTPKEAD